MKHYKHSTPENNKAYRKTNNLSCTKRKEENFTPA